MEWVRAGEWGAKGQIALAAEIRKHNAEVDKQGNAYGNLPPVIKKVAAETILLATATGRYFGEIKQDRISAIKAVYETVQTTILTTALPAQRELTQSMIDYGFRAAEVAARIPKDFGKAMQAWATNFQKTMSDISMFSNMFYSQLTEISNQAQKNENINLDNQYKKRREVIDKSTADEKTKAALIIALDSEFEQKRRAVANKAAQSQKALSIIQAVINTAEGMTKALAQGGILGPILAAVVAAFGAIQISLIKSQPIPMARGGILTGPTVSRGGGFLAGEAGAEAVIPLNSQKGRAMLGGRGGSKLVLNINVGDQLLKQLILETTQEYVDLRKLKLKAN
jgi:hypothetical protein